MNERELRRTLEKIELKYLHTSNNQDIQGNNKKHSAPALLFKLTAAQKYVQVCTELIKKSDSFNFTDLDTAFNLVVKPAGIALEYLQAKKDPDTLDMFFLYTIELFKCACERAEHFNQLENAHKCRLMCIDVHKLRLLTLKSLDRDALDHTVRYMNDILQDFPSDGRFWFQSAIIEFTFFVESTKIKSFQALDSISRAILAQNYPISSSNASSLISKRVSVDFSNTLLNLAVNDFQDFSGKDLQTWSFVKYFESFSECGTFSLSELVALLLFVMAFYRLSDNSYHLKLFLESVLNTKNQIISDFWPFIVLCILKLADRAGFKPSDAIWFKIYQLLKSESKTNGSLISSRNFESFFNGTFLEGEQQSYKSNLFIDYDFDEEFSIERDNVIEAISEYFIASTGQFNEFISIRETDQSLRLGSHFCEKDSSSEDERELEDLRTIANSNVNVNKQQLLTTTELDDSIEVLRNKLASLSPNPQIQTEPIDYLNNLFILDTNVLLSGSQAIRSELLERADRFLIPLIVISEIFKLKDSNSLNDSKSSYAQNAWEFLEPLIKSSSLQVYNCYGRLLRPQEIAQQLALMMLTRSQALNNDDQIILLASQYHRNFPFFRMPILLTEDLNMRLKAKSKGIISISVKEFRNLCNC